MKTTANHVKRLTSLRRRIKRKSPSSPLSPPIDPVSQLVRSFLQWNSTRHAAEAAYDHLMAPMVDNNDLRVSYSHEVIELIGKDYPQVEERADRMREALNEIFRREHAVSLESLASQPKKEIRAYLESLPGMMPYGAAQVTLLSFGGHGIPVDDKLTELLTNEEVVPTGALPNEVTIFLERHIKASDAVNTHFTFQAWADSTRRRLLTGQQLSSRTAASRSTHKKKKKSNKKRKKK